MSAPLELWGGAECTVNRVGEVFFDQLERTGHARRLEDYAQIHALGLRTVREGVVWERHADAAVRRCDFTTADARLARARQLGLEVIVGLEHHGSGPRGTSLLEESFVTGLARYASRVAERYPFVSAYTPINEPLTTARFSGLYGFWYPHHRDPRSFIAALLVQTRATCAAMAAIRKVNPLAKLVQTEDLGTTFASPRLQYQADFENLRRWLSLDLLFGRVDATHPLRRFLVDHGARPDQLDELVDQPCPPDLIGVNYYVTSDRSLDERLQRYPPWTHGGNGRDVYADVEAVRVRPEGIVGHEQVLLQAWERYRVPLAITEVHLGAEPRQQVAWLRDAWTGAVAAVAQGAVVRAVTSWAMFGSYDWDSLVVEDRGHYEPGAFDARGPVPTPTAVAAAIRTLTQPGASASSLDAAPGWWREPERLLYGPTAGSTRSHSGAFYPHPDEAA
jgi:dTDP-4-dehydrorhamnose reductase